MLLEPPVLLFLGAVLGALVTWSLAARPDTDDDAVRRRAPRLSGGDDGPGRRHRDVYVDQLAASEAEIRRVRGLLEQRDQRVTALETVVSRLRSRLEELPGTGSAGTGATAASGDVAALALRIEELSAAHDQAAAERDEARREARALRTRLEDLQHKLDVERRRPQEEAIQLAHAQRRIRALLHELAQRRVEGSSEAGGATIDLTAVVDGRDPLGGEEAAAAPLGATTVVADVEREQGDDELTAVEGIGPEMARALRAAGIDGLAGLAAADDAQLRAAVADAGLRFAPSLATWSQQARRLARVGGA